MTYPPDPGRQDPPPADPFLAPPSFEPYGGGPTPASPPPGGGATYPPPTSPTPPYQPPSGPPYQPPPGSPYQQAPSSPYPPGPASPPYPTSPYGPPGPPYQPPPRRKRRGLLIAGIAAAAALVLCLGGGAAAFLLLRDTDRNGAESPTVAVQEFLQAVYRDGNPDAAAQRVCSEARDQGALSDKIAEIQSYQEEYVEPSFTWSTPEVVEESGELTIVATTVTMVTGDEKTADLPLRVGVLDKDPHGWWVCELETAADPEEPPASEDGGS